MAAASLPLDELANACAEQTQRYSRRRPSDPIHCFELLRRALAEGSPEAFTYVYRIYERQVLIWVHLHPRFEQTGESAEFFANAALNRFYFALRGQKFSQFASLAQVLAYLKACVHSGIAQHIRDHEKLPVLPLEEAWAAADPEDVDAELQAAELWQHICRCLPDDRDQHLARCAFVLNLKPKAIVAAHPAVWRSEREVSLALYRLRQVLRSDPELRQRLGRPAGAEART
ncbi:MAG: hypothetical protein IT318_08050 [Anaerolineales bacterium]|nr:hypothetical protein [Anaerolineales bacterium]